MEPQTDLLNEAELQVHLLRRRAMMPVWIKIFLWIFLVFGVIATVAFVVALLGYNFESTLYGLSSQEPLSLTGILLLFIFLLKGITAFGLWMEKDWAINLGFADAVLGIAICLYTMVVVPFLGSGFALNLRIELVALIPYFLWLRKIKSDWELTGRK